MGDPLETDFWPIFGHFWPPGGGPGGPEKGHFWAQNWPEKASRTSPKNTRLLG